jgi:hypothetical protein
MEIHIKIIGCLLVALALIHIIFPKYFHWDKELSLLSLVNRQMMKVHTFFVAFTVLLMGTLCLTSSTELIETNLGKKISLGLGVFWAFRFFIQLFGYSTALWKGKKFETIVHVSFILLWAYFSISFISVYYK